MIDRVAPAPEWMPKVQEIVTRLAGATANDKLSAITRLTAQLGPEAGAGAKRLLFSAPAPKPAPAARLVAKAEAEAAIAQPQPKEPQPKAPKPKAPVVPLREWTEVAVPAGANELETLTYVPGLVGDITEWIVAGARRPNRMMALGVANVVVGTLVGRCIQGPTDSATHLYVILLAPTGYGKDWPLNAGAALMDYAGASDLLGPHEWASAPGFEKRMARTPLMACFIDELGDELAKVKSQSGNVWLTAIIGLLKKSYNAWNTIITAEKVKEESVRIDWAAPSIVGAATPEKFFETLQPGDLESGFANRLLILPFEGCRRPPEQSPQGSDQPPQELLAALRAVRRKPSVDLGLTRADGPVFPTRERVGWGAGAEAVYLAFSRETDALEDANTQRYQLSMRACENAVRLATITAVGRGSQTVDVEDIEWAIALARRSVDAACGGVAQYMRQYFEFPKLRDRVFEWIGSQPNGFGAKYKIERAFRGNVRNGFELGHVLAQLVRENRIVVDARATGERGPAAAGYQIVRESDDR
jgi:hypothetical protein